MILMKFQNSLCRTLSWKKHKANIYIHTCICMDLFLRREKVTVVAFGEGNRKPGNEGLDIDLHPTVSLFCLKFFAVCLYYL